MNVTRSLIVAYHSYSLPHPMFSGSKKLEARSDRSRSDDVSKPCARDTRQKNTCPYQGVALCKASEYLDLASSHTTSPLECRQLRALNMRLLDFLSPSLLTLSTFSLGAEALRKPSDSVLLSSVKTLTLRKDAKTSHRRVSAVPQV